MKSRIPQVIEAIHVMKSFAEDIDKIMEDELLDAYDSPDTRQIIKAVFIAVFAEICDNVDEVINVMDDYMCDDLGEKLENTIMSKMKLNPAIESLKKIFQEKNPNDPQEFEIMNLISGIISRALTRGAHHQLYSTATTLPNHPSTIMSKDSWAMADGWCHCTHIWLIVLKLGGGTGLPWRVCSSIVVAQQPRFTQEWLW